MRYRHFLIASLFFLTAIVASPALAQEGAKQTANQIWENYLLSPKGLLGDAVRIEDDVLRYLWKNHVRPELEQPSDVFLALLAMDIGAKRTNAELATFCLKTAWVSLLDASMLFKDPAEQAAKKGDLILESLQVCPEVLISEITITEMEIFTGTSELLMTTATQMIEVKNSDSDYANLDEGFVEEFRSTLKGHAEERADPLGSTSLAALAVLADAGILDSKEIADLVDRCAAETWPDPEVRNTARRLQDTPTADWKGVLNDVAIEASGAVRAENGPSSLLNGLDEKIRTKATEEGKDFKTVLDGGKTDTKKVDRPGDDILRDGINKGKDVTKK